MIPYPNINPDLLVIGPVHIRWYGVMYVLGFVASYFLIQKQERCREIGLTGTTAQDLVFYLAIGLIVGARLGYVLFYQYGALGEYLKNPLEIIATWRGGMSFHGGLIGAVIAGLLFSRRRKLPFLAVADSTAVTVPSASGSAGSAISSMPNSSGAIQCAVGHDLPTGGPVPRHPSQLYEAAGKVSYFYPLWTLRQRPFQDGTMLVFFMLFYGIIRFFLEFFREPDPHIGFCSDCSPWDRFCA